ncbi:hypothetical protein V8E55_006446 [Tylopilus felleus]
MQYQRTLSSSSMAPSERSISSGSSNASPPQNLVALPSMRHSLAALPTMSSLPRDMMLDNAAAHSKARMEHALQKQRQQGPAAMQSVVEKTCTHSAYYISARVNFWGYLFRLGITYTTYCFLHTTYYFLPTKVLAMPRYTPTLFFSFKNLDEVFLYPSVSITSTFIIE